VWPDELGKGFQDYVKLKLEHVVYDFMCTYVRRIKPDTRWKKILKMNAGNPFICHFTPRCVGNYQEWTEDVGSSQESKHKSREKVDALIQHQRGKEEGEWYIHVE